MDGEPASVSGTRLGHQPAIDGIRGVAVLAVVLYHAGVGWMGGGFLGVDAFFVVSGFLITTLLVDERAATGRIRFGAFWIRRVRRLLPAFLLLIVGIAGYIRWIAPAEAARSIRDDAVASLLYVSNWWFVVDDQSYFEQFSAPSPLRHTWSLAIEEQWYVVWPVVAAVVLGWASARRRRAAGDEVGAGDLVSDGGGPFGLGGVEVDGAIDRRRLDALGVGCLVLAVASAVLMGLVVGDGDVSRAYYGTDTRAQALLVGAAAGLFAWRRRPDPRVATPTRRTREVVAAVAVAGFVCLVAVVTAFVFVVDLDAWLYRGGFLAIAVGWAVVVLASTNGMPGPVRSVFSARPLVLLGTISYGVYLWHWPVQLALTPARLDWPDAALIAVRLALTMALAVVSYVVVERPLRRAGRARPAVPVPRLVSAVAAGVVVAVASVSLATAGRGPGDRLVVADGPLSRTGASAAGLDESDPSQTPRTSGTSIDEGAVGDGVGRDQGGDALVDIDDADDRGDADDEDVDGESADGRDGSVSVVDDTSTGGASTGEEGGADDRPSEPPLVVTVGDSVAFDVGYFSGGTTPYRVDTTALLGCGVIPDELWIGNRRISRSPECADWVDSWRRAGAADAVVVFLGSWEVFDPHVDGEREPVGSPAWDAHLAEQLRVGIEAATERGAFVGLTTVPCLDTDGMVGAIPSTERRDAERIEHVNRVLRSVVATFDPDEVRLLDYAAFACPDGTDRVLEDGSRLRPDGQHPTATTAPVVWDWIETQLEPVLAARG